MGLSDGLDVVVLLLSHVPLFLTPGKNAGEGCHSQPQGTVPGMEFHLSSLLHWQVDSLVPP